MINKLKKYFQKRKKGTPEPLKSKPKVAEKLNFVVHKHHARSLHYDLRLESEGVLKSWAVPKGPSMDPTEKHLAVHVEDHPLEYRHFKGVIPEGHYGAGKVEIWDKGTYTAIGATTKEETEKAMRKGMREGKFTFILYGKKLKGEFTLIRFKGNEKNWLLIKVKDKKDE